MTVHDVRRAVAVAMSIGLVLSATVLWGFGAGFVTLGAVAAGASIAAERI